MEKLRVGVIGAGRWSASAHLPGFTGSPLCEVVVICDVDRDLAEARAREFGIPDVETDFQKFFRGQILMLWILLLGVKVMNL
jgi:predicted dehydrogenase